MTVSEMPAPNSGERRRWPLVRRRVEVPDWVVQACTGDDLEWQRSMLLGFDEDGVPMARQNEDVRHSENVLMSADRNAALWTWFLPIANQGFAAWRNAHPGYLPDDAAPERGQVIRYRPGHFFTAHSDFSFFPHSGGLRVLMALVGISDATAYEGGELVFETCSARYKLGRGDLVIYPAALLHEVEPIRKGQRVTMLAELTTALTLDAFQRYVDQFLHEPEADA